MSVALSWVRIANLVVRPQLFSGNQEAVLGGPSLPIPRMGDRFAADITTSQFRQDGQSLAFMADLFEASTADARIAIRQPNVTRTFSYGAAVVDGAAQAGTALSIRNGRRSATLVRGQFISIVHAGVHYVHMVAADVILSSGGTGILAIWPMLRFLTVDGEPVELDDPMIEGQLMNFDTKGVGWSRNRTDPISFSIVERA